MARLGDLQYVVVLNAVARGLFTHSHIQVLEKKKFFSSSSRND